MSDGIDENPTDPNDLSGHAKHWDWCPICRDGLDTGLECDHCGYDMMPVSMALVEVEQLRAENERLRAENERLRNTLEVVLDDLTYADHGRVMDYARSVLNGKD